jgi:ribosomal protein L24
MMLDRNLIKIAKGDTVKVLASYESEKVGTVVEVDNEEANTIHVAFDGGRCEAHEADHAEVVR